jgi:hypothetical protein
VVYPLPEILLVLLCGTMAGRRKLEILRRRLPSKCGIASHDTLSTLPALSPTRFFQSGAPTAIPDP